MQRACDFCGGMYEAKRRSSRYCTPNHRVQAHTAGLAAPNADRPPAPPVVAAGWGPVEVATVAELTAAGRLESALGRATVALAVKIDTNRDTGSGLASLTREWRATLAAATAGVTLRVSAVDDLRAKREARRGA